MNPDWLDLSFRRREGAVEQTLSWAQEAAERGAFDEALDWLDVVDQVDKALPAEWEDVRLTWRQLAGDTDASLS
jgi:hypothetical protein